MFCYGRNPQRWQEAQRRTCRPQRRMCRALRRSSRKIHVTTTVSTGRRCLLGSGVRRVASPVLGARPHRSEHHRWSMHMATRQAGLCTAQKEYEKEGDTRRNPLGSLHTRRLTLNPHSDNARGGLIVAIHDAHTKRAAPPCWARVRDALCFSFLHPHL